MTASTAFADYLDSVRKEPLPADHPRCNRVELAQGVHTILLEIAEDDLGWTVAGAGYTRTSHGLRADDTRARTFPKEAAARSHANNWFQSLTARGWQRVR